MKRRKETKEKMNILLAMCSKQQTTDNSEREKRN
jgi:hypothetical protein